MSAHPLCLELYGSLAEVLLRRGYLEAYDERPVPRRVQFVRYACGDARLARLCRIELETDKGKRSFLPLDSSESLNLCFDVEAGERLTARLIRGRNVDPAALPEPFPDVFIALEVIG